MGVCARAEGSALIDKCTRNECTRIDTERPKGKGKTRTHVNTHRRGSKQSAIMKSTEHNIGKLRVSICGGANRSNWINVVKDYAIAAARYRSDDTTLRHA